MGKYIAKKPDKKGIIHFTSEENQTWAILINRQMTIIQSRACDEFMAGLSALNLAQHHIPQCGEVSEILTSLTGWSVIPVQAMISVEEFFRLLVDKKFPAASFIRTREELDYLQEPDIFHELFGHCPLLTYPPYADFLQNYGEISLLASEKARSLLGRLFWFTIEFGLIQTAQGLRIYGGGILSSYEETIFSLESPLPKRKFFEPEIILNTDYNYEAIQKEYFIIHSFEELLKLDLKEMAYIAEKIVDKNENNKKDEQSHDFVTC